MARIVTVEPKNVLLSRDYISDLSKAVVKLSISRREVVNWGTDTLYDWVGWDGEIRSAEGEVIDIYPGVFDDAHGEDASGVWISELRRHDSPKRRPRQTLTMRLSLYDAIFRLSGRPVVGTTHRKEIENMRRLLRGFDHAQRSRYLDEVSKLRRDYSGTRVIHYGAAVRRLRLRFAEELGVHGL